jgi:CubicO group peptidase (beta-lactamase class C family)
MRIARRTKGTALIAVCAALVSGVLVSAPPAGAEDFSKPFRGFAPPNTVLGDASPASVGLDPAPIATAVDQIRAHESAPVGGHPMYAGAVGIMGHEGKIVERDASGWALRYANATTELPRDQWVPMHDDTLFDLASVSKLFTSLAVVQLMEEGKVDLESPVAAYLPEFAANGKGAVTVRQLLTHTSGFVAWLPLWSKYPDKASRIKAVMDQPLTNPAGSTYLYSDLNLITLGVMVERLRGGSLDQVVADRITGPLGMTDTGYNPSDRARTAATEFQTAPARGMVWGEVHDENAWSLGGVAGHAGVFSTVDDMAILSQALLNGGTYRGHRVLTRDSVTSLVTNFNGDFPGDDHGLGFELNQRWYMDSLSGPRTAGHTGYTGTSIVIDFSSRSFAILLTNRVHPSRSWGSNNLARREWAGGLGQAMGVRPEHGDSAWFSGAQDATTHTLGTPTLTVPASGANLGFDLFLDTEETDLLTLEPSTDGGATWAPQPFETRDRGETGTSDGVIAGSGDRRWVQARADLAPGSQQLRWRYTTDGSYLGRGVYVDDILVGARSGALLDGEKTPEVLVADGWTLRTR